MVEKHLHRCVNVPLLPPLWEAMGIPLRTPTDLWQRWLAGGRFPDSARRLFISLVGFNKIKPALWITICNSIQVYISSLIDMFSIRDCFKKYLISFSSLVFLLKQIKHQSITVLVRFGELWAYAPCNLHQPHCKFCSCSRWYKVNFKMKFAVARFTCAAVTLLLCTDNVAAMVRTG